MPVGKALKFVVAGAMTAAGVALQFTPGGQALGLRLLAGGVLGGIALLTSRKGAKVSPASIDRLTASFDLTAFRKTALGNTALPFDVRYGAYTGTDQEYYEQIAVVASHKINSVDEIWFDTELAWTLAGGAQGRYAGYLTVAVKLEGTSANTVSIDAGWGSAQRLTGCAYLHLEYKRTGNSKKAESPFSQTIPTRVTVRGKAALVPDPRLSTSAGGSGAQDMADQSTWAYATAADSGRNPACQLLFCLLGWKIGGKIAVGWGIPSARIDFASFITAANMCDESVAKAAGGTEPRYRADTVFSEGDDPATVIGSLCAAMNAELTDENGRIALRIDHDDLSAPGVALTEADIVDGDDWNPTGDSGDAGINIVRGRYTDPSDGSLYQLLDYPQVTLTGADYGSPDGIQRIETFDQAPVQSPSQAQRLAKLKLQRKQYPGIFTARFTMKAWAASYGKPMTLSHASLGWTARKFRVRRQVLQRDGSVVLVLREAASAQYSWSAEEAATVAPAVPTAYDPLNAPVLAHLNTVEIDADVTGHITGPVEIEVQFDHSGALQPGQLPRNDAFKLFRNGVDVTTLATWTSPPTVVSGSYTGTVGAATGILNTTALAATSRIRLIASYLGKAWPFEAIVKRVIADPPISGGSGGGSGGSSDFDNSLDSITSASMAAVSREMIVTVGSAGQVSLAADLEVSTAPASPAGTFIVYGIWQWWNGAAWADQGTETISAPHCQVVDEGSYVAYPGVLSVAATKTGLTVASSQKFRFRARNSSGTRTMYLTGSASVQG